MKKIFLFLFMINQLSFGQELSEKLNETYEKYKETSLTKRLFKHKQILEMLEKLKQNSNFNIEQVTKSTQGREIFQVKIGHGKTPVLLWSQMHGDEATATMALFDLFNFFNTKDELDQIRNKILENCTLYFVPMLNPDGAEVWKRRTALDIDMNRDALRLQTPEGRLLKQLQQTIKPEFGFNLHDQSPRYSVGQSKNQVAISFLATAYDQDRSINEVRKKAMQMIVTMNKTLQNYIPNKIGRYSDEHEPRAFGDNIQKWGTSLILIESGGYKNDPEKMYLRQMNYIGILSGLMSIAEQKFKTENFEEYNQIPENGRAIFDLIIRNVEVVKQGKTIKMDLAINRNEKINTKFDKFVTKATIEELGDLSVFFGIEEIDGTDLVLESKEEISHGGKAEFILKKNNEVKYVIKNGTPSKR